MDKFFLKEVQDLALRANLSAAQARVDETIKSCKATIKILAAAGEYKAEIPLYNVQANKDEAQSVVNYFVTTLGFKAKLSQIQEFEDSHSGSRMVDCIHISWD